MTAEQMRGLFWELAGLPTDYPREPGWAGGPGVDVLIWEGICELARLAKPLHLRKLHSFSLLGGTERYPMPDDFLEYLGVEEPITIGGLPLVQSLRGPVEELRDSWSVSNQEPSRWYEAGVDDDDESVTFGQRLIGFFPAPVSAATAKMPYLRLPLELADPPSEYEDDYEYPDLPRPYHRLPVLHAAASFLLEHQTERPAKDPAPYLARFQAGAAALRAETNERLQRAYRPVMHDAIQCAVDWWMPL